MNTKHFPTFSILVFLLVPLFISCSSEDRFVICKNSEYDCDYQHRISGIITVTKGSSRVHYILTKKGLEKSGIKEGEPVAYNPETGTAVVKEVTDSSIDVFSVDTRNGRHLSSEIALKPKMTGKDGKPFFAVPTLLSSCILNNGTIILLINYEKPEFTDSGSASEIYYFLYVYEKGDPKKLKKYIFPYDKDSENETEDEQEEDFWEDPKNIQCNGKNIYIFSERNYANGEFFHHNPQPNWVLGKIDTTGGEEKTNITDLAFIAYDNTIFNHYAEKENAVYTITRSSEQGSTALRILRLDRDGELPEEPVEKDGGDFLFSETPDGKPLIFFVKTRSRLEDQRLELLPF